MSDAEVLMPAAATQRKIRAAEEMLAALEHARMNLAMTNPVYWVVSDAIAAAKTAGIETEV